MKHIPRDPIFTDAAALGGEEPNRRADRKLYGIERDFEKYGPTDIMARLTYFTKMDICEAKKELTDAGKERIAAMVLKLYAFDAKTITQKDTKYVCLVLKEDLQKVATAPVLETPKGMA